MCATRSGARTGSSARALAETLKRAGLKKERVDGLCVSSFTLAPDSAVGLTQHLGLTTRWLDHIPMGGAAGVVALRRAARAVQMGDADIVACIAGDTNQVDSFRLMNANFSQFARDAVYPLRLGRAQCQLRLPHRLLHAHLTARSARISASCAWPSATTRSNSRTRSSRRS